jgi:asparagine synthase (glutamine-hydrolysing)
MCGIAGFWSRKLLSEDKLKDIAFKMSRELINRGPDDNGVWLDKEDGLALAFRRLSIIELSKAGHQPMVSSSGRYVIIYNGEIYNHLELRDSLKRDGLSKLWRGKADSETLIESIEYWGISETLKKCIGMFAFALWDKKEKNLVFARDRIGEKPLYYGTQNDFLIFSSDLKAFKQHPAFNKKINRNAISLFFRYGYIPSPYSIYEKIYKLTPGSYITFSSPTSQPKEYIYWESEYENQRNNIKNYNSDVRPVEELDILLNKVIKQQIIADVPVGVFLSGGVDSSLIAAIAKKQSSAPVKTFTIGFEDDLYNEAPDAKNISTHLKTEHHELVLSNQMLLDVIPKIPQLFSEPFSDSSQIPTFLVSKLAKNDITVALSGDGGDELFGGYTTYSKANSILKKMSYIPSLLRGELNFSSIISIFEKYPFLKKKIESILSKKYNFNNGGLIEKLIKINKLINSNSPNKFYENFISINTNPDNIVIGAKTVNNINFELFNDLHFYDMMMGVDMLTYLPDNIMCKVDRCSMGVSLETRAPFLDHRVIAFSSKLPLEMKIRGNKGKWILKKLVNRYIPTHLIDRPKKGFSVPLNELLRGPLKDWCIDLLNESEMKKEGYLKSGPINDKLKEHLSGNRDWSTYLWNVLMFQQWLKLIDE